MSLSDGQFEDQLLAYHMGWLDRAETEAVERLIDSSLEVAARSRELRDSIEPLADWNVLPAVENLESQVLRRVRRQTGAAVDPIAETVKLDPVPANRDRVLRLPFSPKELLAVAASVTIILTIVVPGFGKASTLAQRGACADNLRQIGAALSQYGFDHDQQLPFAGRAGASDNWLRGGPAGVRQFRNSRNRFVLLLQGYLHDPTRFVCPADRQAVVMRFEDVSQFDDFAEPRNCSYDSQIMFGSGQRISEYPQKVVYADSNPIFDGDGRLGSEPAELNSVVHRGLSGQNILRLDRSVSWTTSPNVGVQNDNIWQIGGRPKYAGSELPQLATDSFMIP